MAQNVEPELSLVIEERGPHTTKIDPENAQFPCCIVWTPIPILSWFIPFIGHIGICRKDGVILDFAGPNYVSVDNFAFGSPTRYIQIKNEQCYTICDTHEGESVHKHNGSGGEMVTWDAALHRSTQEFQHHSYNLLTCNCHSFVANGLNRLGFQAGRWNVVKLATFILLKGQFVSKASFVRTYLPFLIVFGLGLTFGGGTFLTYLLIIIFVLVGWFLLGTYCFKKLIYV